MKMSAERVAQCRVRETWLPPEPWALRRRRTREDYGTDRDSRTSASPSETVLSSYDGRQPRFAICSSPVDVWLGSDRDRKAEEGLTRHHVRRPNRCHVALRVQLVEREPVGSRRLAWLRCFPLWNRIRTRHHPLRLCLLVFTHMYTS